MKALKIMLHVAVINLIVLYSIIVQMPATVPIHFNFMMEADRFGSKWILMGLGFIPVVVSLGMIIWHHVSKEDILLLRSGKAEKISMSALATFLIVMTWFPVYLVLQYHSSKPATAPIFALTFTIGLLIIILSNFMGIAKYKPGPFRLRFGIRTPWTIRSEAVWKKTHRLGAYTGVLGGISMCVFSALGFFYDMPALSVTGLFFGLILTAGIPIVYSYVIYKRGE